MKQAVTALVSLSKQRKKAIHILGVRSGGVRVSEVKETPERRRERVRQEELRRNPTGNMGDTFNRANSDGLVDLAFIENNILTKSEIVFWLK